ncbi:MAG: tetratricopeptide repeat protein [Pseudomonadota bacterium]|nr:tetratricopeptide repeat protein [Pseudomonadota bacterium]
MSNTRNTLFTIITVVVIPLLFFVLVEFALGLMGVGTHYQYFNQIDIDGEAFYQENPDFADQFYPPSLNVGPLQNTFAAERSDDRLRVFVLGGSAAMGFPHKNHGVDRLLAAQLRSLFPNRDVEVVNTAMTSVNSHVVYQVAQTLPFESADVAVILMGNNEVVGPYGPGTFNQNFLSSLSAIRALQALKRTRLWQLLDSSLAEVQSSDAKADLEWQGMQMFVDNGVAEDDPRMSAVYEHFEGNLRDIVDTLHAKGMHVVLSTVPVNLRQSAPFLSIGRDDLSASDEAKLAALRERAEAQALNGRWREAQDLWQQAIALDAGHADSHFQLATSLENLGEFALARSHYERALDLDGLRFRADTRINAIIERVAREYDSSNVSFVNSSKGFDRASAPYAPGWDLLVEHVHYDFSGNAVLARIFARAIARHLSPTTPPKLLKTEEVAARIGFPNHETIENLKNLQGMAKQPPFPGQSNYQDYLAFLATELSSVTGEVGEPKDVVRRRQQVLVNGEGDWKLHFEMTALARHLKNKQAQYYHLDQLFKLYPHNRESYINLATLLSQDGRWAEVIPLLERSLSYTRGREELVVEAVGWLGTAHLKTGNTAKATELLLSIPEDYPDQIGMSLRAYGNLIKHSVDSRDAQKTEQYLTSLENYANTLVASGASESYPRLNQRMAQLMNMGGDKAGAARWRAAR